MSSDGYYTEQVHGPHEYLDLGNFELASGFVLPDARLAYKTMGTLSDAKDNAVLLPHMYSGTAAFMQAYVGPGRPLDPDRYFFILPAQFGDGFSSSPSNTPPPFDRGAFPPVAISDDVRAQHRLVTEHFGISQLALVSGWSMGGQQTLEWAVRYPDAVAGRCRSPPPPGTPITARSSATCTPKRCAATRRSATASTRAPPRSAWACAGTPRPSR